LFASRIHEKDLAGGYGELRLPDAIDRKIPSADRDWRWQFIFPSSVLPTDAEDAKDSKTSGDRPLLYPQSS
jgi:hypothetical protein